MSNGKRTVLGQRWTWWPLQCCHQSCCLSSKHPFVRACLATRMSSFDLALKHQPQHTERITLKTLAAIHDSSLWTYYCCALHELDNIPAFTGEPKQQNASTNPSGFYLIHVNCLKCLIDYLTISEFLPTWLSKAVFWIRFPYSFSHSESLLPMAFFRRWMSNTAAIRC